MQDFSKERRNKGSQIVRLSFGVLTVLILALLLFVLGRASFDMYGKFKGASDNRYAAEQELGALEEKKERIEASVGALSSERGLEGELRARFGVARPGEGEIIIVRDKEDAEVEVGESKNILQRIWEALFVW